MTQSEFSANILFLHDIAVDIYADISPAPFIFLAKYPFQYIVDSWYGCIILVSAHSSVQWVRGPFSSSCGTLSSSRKPRTASSSRRSWGRVRMRAGWIWLTSTYPLWMPLMKDAGITACSTWSNWGITRCGHRRVSSWEKIYYFFQCGQNERFSRGTLRRNLRETFFSSFCQNFNLIFHYTGWHKS